MREYEVRNYLRLLDIYNEKIDNQEKEIIDDFLHTLKTRKLNIFIKSNEEYFHSVLKKLFHLEVYDKLGCITDDVSFELSDIDDSLAEFVFRRDKVSGYKYINRDMKVRISKSSILSDYLNDSVERRLYAANCILKSFFHEIEHFKQLKKLTMNISSLDNLRFTKEFIYINEELENKISPPADYIYKINHDSFSIENDADIKSFERVSLLFNHKTISNIKNCSVHKLDMMLSDIKENGIYGSFYDSEEYINNNLDNLLPKNLYLLEKYPILLKEYENDGTKKNLSALYVNMLKEISEVNNLNVSDKDKKTLIKDIYKMYYDLILKRLKVNSKDEINNLIDLIGNNNLVLLLNDIKESFRQDRIYMSNVSDRKYELKCINDSDLNYLKKINPNGMIKFGNNMYSMMEYYNRFIKINASKKIEKIIVKYVIPRIPECGYFMLKDGSKILPNIFINQYLIERIKDTSLSLYDIINIMKELVLSTREQTHMYELERINSVYQKKCSVLDNVYNNNYTNQYDNLLGGKSK